MGVALGLFALVTSAIMQVEAGRQQKRQANENARVREDNAGRAADRILEDELPEVIGTIRATAGASGVESTVGSPYTAMMQAIEDAKKDAADIRREGTQGATYLRRQGESAQRANNYAAVGGVLRGGASIYSQQSQLSSVSDAQGVE